jgi:cyclophilin family peptidyl-prolyl cis-trans isomerase
MIGCDNGWMGGLDGKKEADTTSGATKKADEKSEPDAQPTAAPADEAAKAAAPAPAVDQAPVVVIETTKGAIVVELYAGKAPKTVANFLRYVDDGFYDGTVFHRVISGFMIQGGGMGEDLARKDTRAPIANEADNGLLNERGTIAMARTGDPHSATSQFFINHGDNASLNHSAKTSAGWGYCVFGRVIDGMDVVDAIAAVPTTTRNGYRDAPAETVVIKSVRRQGK